MIRPAELVSLLIDTASAISQLDFNNPSSRQDYMKFERKFTQNLAPQVKRFMVRNIEKTPFDDEQVNIQGDMYTLKELVGSLQKGGPVKQMQSGGITEEQLRAATGAEQEPIPGEVVVPPEQQQPREANGATPDTVPMTAKEGDFVLNSLVKVTESIPDLKRAVGSAIDEAAKDGVDIVSSEGRDVDIIVGDDEIIIPKNLVPYVGLDKLTKMDNRGKELMKVIETASKQREEQQEQT